MSKLGNLLSQFNESNSLVDKLSKFAGQSISPGRVTIKGYPVDIEDSDGSFITMNVVDGDAAKNLLKELRKANFKVKISNRSLTIDG